ncbi:MAG: Gfo/Idh/MocA family protein [Pyrinomonadaceae bacterium]
MGNNNLSRRDLLRNAALGSIGLSLLGCNEVSAKDSNSKLNELIKGTAPKAKSMIGVPFEKHETVRIGIIGTGLRGRSVLNEFVNVPNVQITALCDIAHKKADKAKAIVTKAGLPEPAVIVNGERGFETLVKRDDVDYVYIATPWEWHTPQALAAMKNGKHVGCEVPIGYTLKDLWALVDTSEKTRKHCMMLENCCYDYDELLVLNLVRAGLFGTIVHGEGAYNHDLRAILFETKDEGLWRRRHHTLRDSNLYPTHGLGPVANYMDINRGDKFEYMVAMSSGSYGLQEYRAEHLEKDDPRLRENYVCGDYNTNLIKTNKGRTIMVQHNVTSPRPYDRINLLQGTKGIFRDYPSRIYFESDKPDHKWKSIDDYKEKYEHELWRVVGEQARKLGGHGGMDYLMCWRLVQCMREGLVPDMDVYDAAAWSAPGPLSEISAAKGSAPIKFPDFTRGGWIKQRDSIPTNVNAKIDS